MDIQDILDLLADGWRPAVEILILAVGIYYVLKFVRGTRGWPVFTGLLAVLLASAILTTALDLTVLRSILIYLLGFFVIAVVVIFQPELRRMLAQLGNLPLFNTSGEERGNIEVIVQAMERLSEVRTGAIIAIEQSVRLADVVESGVPINCDATPEMIETIFFPNNAIHDGGVLIRGNQITHAACIFPLTRRQDLNKSLGTRHRAAIGLSEETDAVVVLASEETGSISYAYKGELERGVTLEELRDFLSSILVRPSHPTNLISRVRLWSSHRHKPTPTPSPGPAAIAKGDPE